MADSTVSIIQDVDTSSTTLEIAAVLGESIDGHSDAYLTMSEHQAIYCTALRKCR
jgi:hypothetical protein